METRKVSPLSVRIDACTLCQLRCPLCPTPGAEDFLGRGLLALDDFQRFLDRNPAIRTIELGSKGEALLNPHLPAMIEHARARGAVVELNQGVNLNSASDEVLEALVRSGAPRLRVSIDGATRQTYAMYRVGGDLRRVLGNVQRINALKQRYGTELPELTFQFIVFRHNVHEMEQAAALAKMLGMKIHFHLNAFPEPWSPADLGRIRKLLGYATREEYVAQRGHHYVRHLCYQMWIRPQVNWDGRLLGCSKNFSFTYAENVFADDFLDALNGPGMERARKLLQGHADPSPDELPCSRCFLYLHMKERGNWIEDDEIDAWAAGSPPDPRRPVTRPC